MCAAQLCSLLPKKPRVSAKSYDLLTFPCLNYRVWLKSGLIAQHFKYRGIFGTLSADLVRKLQLLPDNNRLSEHIVWKTIRETENRRFWLSVESVEQEFYYLECISVTDTAIPIKELSMHVTILNVMSRVQHTYYKVWSERCFLKSYNLSSS